MLVNAHGLPLTLGDKLGEGGEGIIYALGNDAVKLYHHPLDALRLEKLLLMVQSGNADLRSIAAWPSTTVHQGRPDSPACGFIMPRAQGGLLHVHYNPKDRKQFYPEENWGFLVKVAQNLAAAVAVLHHYGIVIGDINESLVMVDEQNSHVHLVDTDSFQVRDARQIFPCRVFSPDYTPPELVGQSLSSSVRTTDHDAFGLAVLMFKTLLGGWHPFDGKTSNPMTIPEKIQKSLYGYGGLPGISPPRLGVPPTILPPDLRDLFLRAFAPRALPQQSRPTAMDWYRGLKCLFDELGTCHQEPSHVYFKALGTCPWCTFEEQGLSFFLPRQAVGKAVQNLSQEQLCRRLLRMPSMVKRLNPVFSRLALSPKPFSLAGKSVAEIRREREFRQASLLLAKDFFENLSQAWHDDQREQQFEQRRREMLAMVLDYRQLAHKHQATVQQLQQEGQTQTLNKYLARFAIDQARIPGIAGRRMTMLAQHGILTAADIDPFKVQMVPGIKDMLFKRLEQWRDDCIKTFVSNPSQGGSPMERRRLDHQYHTQRAKMEQALRNDLAVLERYQKQIQDQRQQEAQQLQESYIAYKQAELDFSILSG